MTALVRADYLGKVDFSWRGKPTTALLDLAMYWHCEIDLAQRILNGQFAEYSPGDGAPGARLLTQAAQLLSGTATYFADDSPEPDEAGVDY